MQNIFFTYINATFEGQSLAFSQYKIIKLIFFPSSYDARSGGGDAGRRWSADDDAGAGAGFGARAHFRVGGAAPAQLAIEDVQRSEAGVYRCRVDFKTAPTRNTLVNLTVIGE